jgi:hypothetical protein
MKETGPQTTDSFPVCVEERFGSFFMTLCRDRDANYAVEPARGPTIGLNSGFSADLIIAQKKETRSCIDTHMTCLHRYFAS